MKQLKNTYQRLAKREESQDVELQRQEHLSKLKELQKSGGIIIKITKGFYTLIDEDDCLNVLKFKWYAHIKGKSERYAVTRIKINEEWKSIMLHRFILNAKKGQFIDHINGEGLDNRKCNLRFCTHKQNSYNKRTHFSKISSKYKGIYFDKSVGTWRTMVKFNNQTVFSRRFKTEKDAAMAYDLKAKELFGEFARLNFR